jgi:hypothetical protein
MNILQQFLSIQLIFMLLFNVLFHFLNIKNLSVSFHPSNTNVYVNKEIQKENKVHTTTTTTTSKGKLHRYNKQYEHTCVVPKKQIE